MVTTDAVALVVPPLTVTFGAIAARSLVSLMPRSSTASADTAVMAIGVS
jgi:hypothetical protein